MGVLGVLSTGCGVLSARAEEGEERDLRVLPVAGDCRPFAYVCLLLRDFNYRSKGIAPNKITITIIITQEQK